MHVSSCFSHGFHDLQPQAFFAPWPRTSASRVLRCWRQLSAPPGPRKPSPGGVHSQGGTHNGGFLLGKITWKLMMTGDTPMTQETSNWLFNRFTLRHGDSTEFQLEPSQCSEFPCFKRGFTNQNDDLTNKSNNNRAIVGCKCDGTGYNRTQHGIEYHGM